MTGLNPHVMSFNPAQLSYYVPNAPHSTEVIEVDLCVYGGTSAGATAAVQAARRGLRTIIVETSNHLGGLTAGGLGLTDFGNKAALGGLAREFYTQVGQHYGATEEWRFEPHVAEAVFERWIKDHSIRVLRREYLARAQLEDQRITAITLKSGRTVRAGMFIDASYEGDLLAAAGVSFTVGREANTTYGETINGMVIHEKHQFNYAVDPHRIEGDPASGLLPGVELDDDFEPGKGDSRIQAYNFRMCLTKAPGNRIPFEKPAGYDRAEYELLARYLRGDWNEVFAKFDPIRGDKTDTNNHGAVSTDFIGRNHRWPIASYAERETIFQAHVTYQKGLQWFLANDPAVPAAMRTEYAQWGLAKDEFVETGGWPHALYIREARRMVSDYVMTENNCRGTRIAEDPAALGAYGMDSHNCRRIVRDGRVWNEGDVQQAGFKPYGISLRSLIPKRGECANLVVPVCVSASHIAYGSIRMEPVFMALGQSAALIAELALKQRCVTQALSYKSMQALFQEAGQTVSLTGKDNVANEIV